MYCRRLPQEDNKQKNKKQKKAGTGWKQQDRDAGEEVLAAGVGSALATRQRKEEEAAALAAVVEKIVQARMKEQQQQLGKEQKRTPTAKVLAEQLAALSSKVQAEVKLLSDKEFAKLRNQIAKG